MFERNGKTEAAMKELADSTGLTRRYDFVIDFTSYVTMEHTDVKS